MCLVLGLDLTFFSTISYRDSQLMFSVLGNYLTYNSYWMETNMVGGWIWEKGKQNRIRKAKKGQKIVLIIGGISVISLVNIQTNP